MAGVYISFPFCNQKCTFCNFASDVVRGDAPERYSDVLILELAAHHWEWKPETLYFGGGTPSLMPPDLLHGILNLVPQSFLSEITLECAPGSIDVAKVALWRDCGINRVSLGVQSFVGEELRHTGRRHTAEVVQADVVMLRDHGIHNINIDLIAGLPGQSYASWQASLEWIERLAAPHVSVYIFEVDDDSRLGKEMLLGGVRYGAAHAPSDDVTAELYERAVAYLAGCGIQRYEVSNFARANWESRHNLKYWQLEPYVGFGLDAHSYDGRYRWSNPDNLEAYLAGSGTRQIATVTDRSEEHFFVGLRLAAGIEPTETEWARFAAPIAYWTGTGLLEKRGKRLRLAEAGFLVSNEIFEGFLDCQIPA